MIDFVKSAWGKVAAVYEWAAEAYADVVGNYPRIALGFALLLMLGLFF
jgi:hypothetical protein